MKNILIVGCGDIALRVIPLLVRRYRVYALVRGNTRIAGLRALGVTTVHGDLDDRRSLARIAGLAEAVLHLAPPPNSGVRDTRTGNLLAALSQRRLPQRLVYVSTSGVYGDCGGVRVNETRPVRPANARACRRVDAESQIRAWARRNRICAAILRVPGIYAAQRLPLERLAAQTPAIVTDEDAYTNHIHADDLAQILVAALRHGRANRIYHASDDSELKMGDYFDAVADACALPRPPRLPRAQVERTVSPSLWSFMNESRRLNNMRMKAELHIRLRYPTVAGMLNQR